MRRRRPQTAEERRASVRNIVFLVLVALVIGLAIAAVTVFGSVLSRFGS